MISETLPEKYRIRNFDKSKESIFNFESQGWPLYKQTIRDFVIAFGASFNQETKTWEIKDDNKILDTEVRRLVDDGMGYGVDEEYVSECNVFTDSNGKYYCNVFTESPIKDINLWLESKFYPGALVKLNHNSTIKTVKETNHFILTDIKKENDSIVFYADQYAYTEDGDMTKLKSNIELKIEEIEYE